jgi:hypothetical protein
VKAHTMKVFVFISISFIFESIKLKTNIMYTTSSFNDVNLPG